MTVEYTHQEVMDLLDANYLGDGIIYADLCRDEFVHDNSRDAWMAWTGHRYEADSMNRHANAVERVAQIYAAQIPVINEQLDEVQDRPALVKWLIKRRDKLESRVNRLRSTNGQKSCLEFAWKSIEHPLAIVGDELDRDPDLVGLPNGVLDMRTGIFRDGQRRDYISKCLGVPWPGWDAKCPEFNQFLSEVFGSDEVVRFVKGWIGLCLTGHVRFQKVLLWNGSGRNGKGVLVNLLLKILGDYGSPGQSELLLDHGRVRNSASHSADICMLQGLRGLFFQEVNENVRFDLSRIKTFSGGDVQVARNAGASAYVRITPTWKLNIVCNHLPHFNGLDMAALDRFITLEFPHTFVYEPRADHERLRDDDLTGRLHAVIHNALPELVEAGMEVLAHGLDVPQSCIEFREEYARDNDPISAWISTNVVYSFGARLEFVDAYKSFCTWWEQTKGKRTPPSDNWFGRNVVRAKVDGQQIRKHRGQTVTYPDIMLLEQ